MFPDIFNSVYCSLYDVSVCSQTLHRALTWPRARSACRGKPMLCMLFIIQEDMSRGLLGAESVSELMEEDTERRSASEQVDRLEGR